MDFLIHNATFRLLKEPEPSTSHEPGIYRVVLDAPDIDRTVTVLIQADAPNRRGKGGRPRAESAAISEGGGDSGASVDPDGARTESRKDEQGTPRQAIRKKKGSPPPLVGQLIWMIRSDIIRLAKERVVQKLQIERKVHVFASAHSEAEKTPDQRDYEIRVTAMAGFLDVKKMQESILVHESLGGLVRQSMKNAGVSRPFVYKQWSTLCRFGYIESSLRTGYGNCGGPGKARPVIPGVRKKAGRLTVRQMTNRAYGQDYSPEQPGMSIEWSAAIRAADKLIPEPKPKWPKRCTLIVSSAFVGKGKDVDGKIELIKPAIGAYPNDRQIQRVLTEGKSQLQLLLEKTTKRHFNSALRGLIARNWQGVPGPGSQWAIDSTVGDIYLRSSFNRAWIIGRPIVYIIVDIWSTAVVGFYVCLTGPSWNTAKISLFNSSADPALLGEAWGYQPILTLDPHPSLCYELMCDRGEYLSEGARQTAMKLIPHTGIAMPYRGDLKGLAEVLHRIEKDAQFLFVPGAMDFRRQELELRRVDPNDSVLTLPEYVQFLHDLFAEYNLTACRRHRVDAHMFAAGCQPSPAGLWRMGFEMAIGFRRQIDEADLVTELLPRLTGRVRRDCVRFLKNDYSSEEVKAAQWTAIARNCGGWNLPVYHYPGAMGRIWTPDSVGAGLLRLKLSPESKVAPEASYEELMDFFALETMAQPGVKHANKMHAIDFLARRTALIDQAEVLTAEAIARATGKAPTFTEARLFEVAAQRGAERSESKTADDLRDENYRQHEAMMDALLAATNAGDDSND